MFDSGFRFFAFDFVVLALDFGFDLAFDLPDDCLEEALELPAFNLDYDLSYAFGLCIDLVFTLEIEPPER